MKLLNQSRVMLPQIQHLIRIVCLLAMAMLPGRSAFAADSFKESQDRVARQIESLLDFGGEITVYSLEPNLSRQQGSFHGYTILSSAELSMKADRVTLLQALASSIRESDGDPFACFQPRHGLRFTKDGRTHDLVICFQCASSQAHGFRFSGFLQSSTAQPAFDRFLADKGVKLPPK